MSLPHCSPRFLPSEDWNEDKKSGQPEGPPASQNKRLNLKKKTHCAYAENKKETF